MAPRARAAASPPTTLGATARREADDEVSGSRQCLDLPREDVVVRVIVGDARHDRGVGAEGDGRQWAPIEPIAADELAGKMLSVGGAATVAECVQPAAPRRMPRRCRRSATGRSAGGRRSKRRLLGGRSMPRDCRRRRVRSVMGARGRRRPGRSPRRVRGFRVSAPRGSSRAPDRRLGPAVEEPLERDDGATDHGQAAAELGEDDLGGRDHRRHGQGEGLLADGPEEHGRRRSSPHHRG